jgi:hypothetical protein
MFPSGSRRQTASGVHLSPARVWCVSTIIVFVSISDIMNEYYRAKLNKRYCYRPTSLTSYTCLSLSSDPGFGEGPSIVSKRISEGPSSTLPLPDLDVGCDLVERE